MSGPYRDYPAWYRAHQEDAAASRRRSGDHRHDEDCDVDPETDACRVCGVDHSGPPCRDCGRVGFHRVGCLTWEAEDEDAGPRYLTGSTPGAILE